MRMWLWYILPTRVLKERTDYLIRIKELKWDIWYYYTGIQVMVSLIIVFAIGLGVYSWITSNLSNYIDTFKTSKIISYVINGLIILTVIILNRKFIFNDAKSEDIIHKAKKLFFISIIALILVVLVNLIVLLNINENIDKFYIANSIEVKEENIVTNLFKSWTFEDKTMYLTPLISIHVIQYLVFALLLYNNAVWISRLVKQKDAINKTNIMFDEEQNIKF